MTKQTTIGIAAAAALIALPFGITAFQASAATPTAARAAVQSGHAVAKAADAETPDANEPDAGQPDRDNVQEGPGNTSDTDKETNDDGKQKSDGDGETTGK